MHSVKTIILLLALTHIGSSLNEQVNLKTLKAVQIVFRHGERVADTNYVTATGSLTNVGKKQMYDLGLYIRERYSGFLKTEFDPSETYVISSDTDRAIRSAELVAYGLYEDFNTDASWNGADTIPYEPIPIRAIPPELDRYLQPKVPCPRLTQLLASTVFPWFNEVIDNNKEVFDIYVQHTGDTKALNRELISEERVINIISFLETAAFNVSHNIPVEDWVRTILQAEDIKNFGLSIYASTNVLPEESKLYGGSLVGLIVDRFQTESRIKLTLYAGHDREMYASMRAMDIYDPLATKGPPLGSALIFELHENSDGGEVLQILFRNDTTVAPHEKTMETCGYPCSLTNFVEATKPIIPVDYEKECQVVKLASSDAAKVGVNVPAIVLWVGVGVILLMVVGSIVYMRRPKQEYFYV